MTEDELAEGLAITQRVMAKVDQLLEPLAREMKIMQWPTEYQAIMWEAVMMEAKARWEKAAND